MLLYIEKNGCSRCCRHRTHAMFHKTKKRGGAGSMEQQEDCFIWNGDGSCCQIRWVVDAKKDVVLPAYKALEALSANSVLREELVQKNIPGMTIMPGYCRPSPLVALIWKNDEKPWIPSLTTTWRVIWALYQVITWYEGHAKYLKSIGKKQQHDAIMKECGPDAIAKRRQQWEDQLLQHDLKNFFKRMKDHGLTEMSHPDATSCMNDFAALLWEHTFRWIHSLEELLWKTICVASSTSGAGSIPLAFCCKSWLTEQQIAACVDPQRLAADSLDLKHFFQAKQSNIIGVHATTDLGEIKKDYVPVYHIHPAHISEVLSKHRNDSKQVYRQFIPYITLWEYAKLIESEL